MANQDPILHEDSDSSERFLIDNKKHPELWQMYQLAQSQMWFASEIKLEDDKLHWEEELTDDERRYIKHVLAFFAASDGIVAENLALRFFSEVKDAACRCFYGFQIAMENIHAETYQNFIRELIRDPQEQVSLLQSITTMDCIKRKAQWAMKWIDEGPSFAERLIAFAVVEGVFFSGAFCAIFWLKKRTRKNGSGVLMPGLLHANELISKDERLHMDFAVALYHRLQSKLPTNVIHDIVREAVDIELDFVQNALPVRLIGMNADLMSRYIRYVADFLLIALGLPTLYNVENPFDWMKMLGTEKHTNFFEREQANYQRVSTKESTESITEMEVPDDLDF